MSPCIAQVPSAARADSSVDHAGAVSGVQSALQSLLQSLSYIPTLVVSELSGFRWLMLASLGNVFVAALTYSLGMVRSRQQQGSEFCEDAAG